MALGYTDEEEAIKTLCSAVAGANVGLQALAKAGSAGSLQRASVKEKISRWPMKTQKKRDGCNKVGNHLLMSGRYVLLRSLNWWWQQFKSVVTWYNSIGSRYFVLCMHNTSLNYQKHLDFSFLVKSHICKTCCLELCCSKLFKLWLLLRCQSSCKCARTWIRGVI